MGKGKKYTGYKAYDYLTPSNNEKMGIQGPPLKG